MVNNKKDIFGRRKQELSKYARAIGHPARIAILRKLAKDGPCNCSQIVLELPLAQSTVSQHLRELKLAGLIDDESNGPSNVYRINKEAIREFDHEFNRLMDNIKHKK